MGEHTGIGWADIPRFPGYRISDDGRVLGKRGKILRPGGTQRPIVMLYRDGAPKAIQVSHLMLVSWVGPPPKGKPCALHRDHDAWNNRIENLRWGSRSDNKEDERRNRGKVSGKPLVLAGVRTVELNGGSARAVARSLGVSHHTVINERRRRNG